MESLGPAEIPTSVPDLRHATREALLHALYEAAEIEHAPHSHAHRLLDGGISSTG
jgi:hypothetical protein